MRHMYNSDGMIAYAGKPRASRAWKGSRYRPRKLTVTNAPESIKADEVALDLRTHQEKIRDILNSGDPRFRHNYNG
jgi:hypothetical protein